MIQHVTFTNQIHNWRCDKERMRGVARQMPKWGAARDDIYTIVTWSHQKFGIAEQV